jgi:hydroxyacylglutathione hydrolase
MPIADVVALPAFEDNYFWCLEGASGDTVVVDPGVAAPVQAYLARTGRRLGGILVTHHHADHVGGVAELARGWRVPVVGPDDARIPALMRTVGDGDRVAIGDLDVEFEVMEVPGHTRTHIAFNSPGRVFCGDTLFSVGCGRLFEGSPAQMLASLDRLAALPPDTLAHCAHEYTLSNCRFALAVEPHNTSLRSRFEEARALRADGRATVPSTIAAELATNPFMRVDQPAVRAAAQAREPQAQSRVEVFAALRRWKDEFRPPPQP